MRLGQFEMLDGEEILDMLQKSQYCHIAIQDGDTPYIVTMFYGYWSEDKRLYVHGAKDGRKADLFNKEASTVCVQILDGVEVVPDEVPCEYFSAYRSLIIDGVIRPTCSEEEQRRGLDLIAKKYAGMDSFPYSEEMLQSTSTWCIEVLAVKGKKIPKAF